MYLVGLLLLGCGLFLFVRRVYLFISGFYERMRREYLDAAGRQLNALFVYAGPADIFHFGLIAGGLFSLFGFFAGFSLGLGPACFWSAVCFLIGMFVPRIALAIMIYRRKLRFNEQLVDALDLLCKCLSAGLSVQQGMRMASEELPSPAKEEFGLVVKDLRMGVPLEKAMAFFVDRLPLDDLKLVQLCITVAQKTGGDLVMAFNGVSETIRNRFNVERKVKALTGEVRMQGVVVCLLPFFLFGAFWFVNPEMTRPLFGSIAGLLVLILVLFLELCGGLMMWRLSKIKY